MIVEFFLPSIRLPKKFIDLESHTMERAQLNLRISETLGRVIDAKRIELSKSLGYIPSRSDVVRQALASYLDIDVAETDSDRRKKPVAR